MDKINRSLIWAVKPEAMQRIMELVAKGFDFDLAFTLVEQGLPEHLFWENPKKIKDVG